MKKLLTILIFTINLFSFDALTTQELFKNMENNETKALGYISGVTDVFFRTRTLCIDTKEKREYTYALIYVNKKLEENPSKYAIDFIYQTLKYKYKCE